LSYKIGCCGIAHTIGIIIIGVIAYLLVDDSIIETISGAICAIGLGIVLKWIPFKKKVALNIYLLKKEETFRNIK